MSTALLVIDVQQGFADEDYWGRRNNPACEENVARLLAVWRERGEPVVFVRHDSDEDGSPLRARRPGNAFKPEVSGEPDLLVVKQVHSAFHGEPDLHAWLVERGVEALVMSGISTNHCVETTARLASDLGYDVSFVLDATHGFDRPGWDGGVVTADELARATAASLSGEFARVVSTDELA